ncbi:MAG TPA: HDOD domain-containing protein [Dissulfurispiraceae bacterium]|nr:HDOD domain-containing protein [Dissulfurispiraceae bacterium]
MSPLFRREPAVARKEEVPQRRTPIKGFAERDLVALYDLGKTKRLKKGEVLFNEGDGNQSIFTVLSGSLRITKTINGKRENIALFSEGIWTGDLTLEQRPVSAFAAEETVVLGLDETGLSALAPNVKIALLKHVNSSSTKIVSDLIARLASSAAKISYMTARQKRECIERTSEYERSELIQGIIRNFPRLPSHVNELAMMLFDEKVAITDVVEHAKHDSALVGLVLKTVNSAYYNLQNKISDFHHAVLLLGFNQIYQILIDNSIKNIMPSSPEFHELHLHSTLMSLVSFEVALISGMKKPVILSTVGLLHDIGKCVILLLKRKNQNFGFLLDMLDHSKIGALLLKEWKIPETVCQCVELQHIPAFAPPEELDESCRENVSILFVSHLCLDYLSGKEEQAVTEGFVDDYLRLLKFRDINVPVLAKKHLLPSLLKKINTLPENVRTFLHECDRRFGGKGATAKTPNP